MENEYIVTKKSVLLCKIKENIPVHQRYEYKGTLVLGLNQLSELISHQASEIIKMKYHAGECKNIIKKIKLKKLDPNQLKELLTYVDFIPAVEK